MKNEFQGNSIEIRNNEDNSYSLTIRGPAGDQTFRISFDLEGDIGVFGGITDIGMAMPKLVELKIRGVIQPRDNIMYQVRME